MLLHYRYTFEDKWLLRQAFVHPSVGEFNNSRLAWIGDAVMNMAISQMVFASSATASCEVLHDRRKVMVRFVVLKMHACTCCTTQPCLVQVMRDFCAEGMKKMGWDKLAGAVFLGACLHCPCTIANIALAQWWASPLRRRRRSRRPT